MAEKSLEPTQNNFGRFWVKLPNILAMAEKSFKMPESKEISSFVGVAVQWLAVPTAATCGVPWLVEEDDETMGWNGVCCLYKNFEGIRLTEGKNGDGIFPETTGVGDRALHEIVCKIWTSQSFWNWR